MTDLNLPPLPEMEGAATKLDEDGFEAWSVYARIAAHEARERILLARIAELEADAARYRWLRDTTDSIGLAAVMRHALRPRWDAAIDAAMGARP